MSGAHSSGCGARRRCKVARHKGARSGPHCAGGAGGVQARRERWPGRRRGGARRPVYRAAHWAARCAPSVRARGTSVHGGSAQWGWKGSAHAMSMTALAATAGGRASVPIRNTSAPSRPGRAWPGRPASRVRAGRVAARAGRARMVPARAGNSAARATAPVRASSVAGAAARRRGHSSAGVHGCGQQVRGVALVEVQGRPGRGGGRGEPGCTDHDADQRGEGRRPGQRRCELHGAHQPDQRGHSQAQARADQAGFAGPALPRARARRRVMVRTNRAAFTGRPHALGRPAGRGRARAGRSGRPCAW